MPWSPTTFISMNGCRIIDCLTGIDSYDLKAIKAIYGIPFAIGLLFFIVLSYRLFLALVI